MEFAWPYLTYFTFLLFVHFFYFQKIKQRDFSKSYVKHIERNLDILVGASFLFFYGLRGFIYTDCFQYYSFFSHPQEYELSYLNGWYEPGYILCNQIVSKFIKNFWTFQFIWTFVDFILLRAVLRRECGDKFYFAFAMLVPFWTGCEMNLFRNTKAILIAFWAMQFIRDGKLLKYVVSIVVASTFHLTALFFLPFYFFVNRPLIKVFVGFCIAAIVFYVMGLDSIVHNFIGFGKMIGGRMDIKATAYATSVETSVFSFGTIYRFFLAIVLLFVYKEFTKKNAIAVNIGLIYCFAFIGLSSITVLRDRFSMMFVLAIVIAMVQMFSFIKQKFIRRGCIFINILFATAFLFVQTNNPAAQYENNLFGISTYSQAYNRVFKTVK